MELRVVTNVAVNRLVLDLEAAGRRHFGRYFARDGTLGHADMLRSKEQLSIKVGNIDRIEVDDFEVGKASQGQILEELAPDASSSNDEDLGVLGDVCV